MTGHAIDTIQIYYGLAIRRNAEKGVEAMKTAIWSEYFHLSSTDNNPQHAMCPKDLDTWFNYQKSILEQVEYKHAEHTYLPSCVLEEIKPIFGTSPILSYLPSVPMEERKIWRSL